MAHRQDPLFSLAAAGAPAAGKLPRRRRSQPGTAPSGRAPKQGRPRGKISVRERLLYSTTVTPGQFAPGMDSECWIRAGADNGAGYSVMTADGRNALAHRLAYELWFGPIPDGLTIDHLCYVKRCVNPDHLEIVTGVENTRRAMRRWVQ